MKTKEEFEQKIFKALKDGEQHDYDREDNLVPVYNYAEVKENIVFLADEYAKQSLEPMDKILLEFADKQGWAVDFSDKSYDGAKEAPMDRIGLLVHICEMLNQFIESQNKGQ